MNIQSDNNHEPFPSLVGFSPAEAEAEAARLDLSVVWLDAPPPRWLPEAHAPRVGRQRLLPDGRLELLRVLVPTISCE